MTYPGHELYDLALQRLPWRKLIRSGWDAASEATKVKRRNFGTVWVRNWRRANPEASRAKGRAWRLANLEKVRERGRFHTNRHYWADPDKARAEQAAYRAANPHIRARLNRKWWAVREERVRIATPAWVNWAEIEAIYAACPSGHHVDHIIPLNGYYTDGKIKVRVSGLHVPWNLQIVSGAENLAKGNRLQSRELRE